ncbi:MAG: cupredoxin domain-containing protein [Rhodocyclaceae bacterium]|nr:cupredoxin domain-containing protein [Rhodocyclaceae bacterium]
MKRTLPILLIGLVSAFVVAEAVGQGMMGGGMMGSGMMGSGMMGSQNYAPQGSGMAVMLSGNAGTSFGHAGDAAKVTRTINVIMNDTMRFIPNVIKVKVGETVRFSLKNNGQVAHNMVLGSIDVLRANAGKQPQAGMTILSSGQTGGMVWQFDQPGTVDFACLIPGHLQAGMVGKIIVEN